MIVVPFIPEHLQQIELQTAQQWMRPMLGDDYARGLVHCEAQTALDDAGQVLAIGGLWEVWPGRAQAVALLSGHAGLHLVALHRFVSQAFGAFRGRIEATVDGDFEAGHRWLRMLGFRLETPNGMRGYLPDGGVSYLYARFT